MKMINANDWLRIEKEHQQKLSPKSKIELRAAGIEQVVAIVVDMAGNEIPVANDYNLSLSTSLAGFCVIKLQSKKPFGLYLKVIESQLDEPRHDEPAPKRDNTNNLLARMREKVRQELGVTREAFAERDIDLPGYEISEDDEGDFEEEMAERAARRVEGDNPDNDSESDSIRDDVPDKQPGRVTEVPDSTRQDG